MIDVVNTTNSASNNINGNRVSTTECLVRKFSLNQGQVITGDCEAMGIKSRRKSFAEMVTVTPTTMVMAASSWSSTKPVNKPASAVASNDATSSTPSTVKQADAASSCCANETPGSITTPLVNDRLKQSKSDSQQHHSDSEYWDVPVPVASAVNNNDDYIKNNSSLTKGSPHNHVLKYFPLIFLRNWQLTLIISKVENSDPNYQARSYRLQYNSMYFQFSLLMRVKAQVQHLVY